jgi:2-polyprenyl-3-methyl-5-hydroxy-6-metoxy-1,4-benzoquinol methylase
MKYEINEREEVLKGIKNIEIYGDVLDIGCAGGGFLCYLDGKFNINSADGIDINIPKKKAHSYNKINYIEANFEEYDFKKQYDFVFMLDSIEHFPDHEAIFEKIRGILKEGGRLIISTPNFLFFPNILRIVVSRDFKYQKIGTLDYTHLRFFTRKSIKRSLANTGFSNISINGINTFPYYSRVIFLSLWLFRPFFRLIFGKDYDKLQILSVSYK